jgi:methionyl-tRNA formyltransferase
VINVHSSLLPKYRGAAPIHAAIINGEDETGVTIMYIAEELDAGDIILQKKTPIYEEDTLETLHDRLAQIGSEALMETVDLIEKGVAPRTPQDHNKATFVKPIQKEECLVDWSDTKENIYNFIRGLNPFPSAHSYLDGKIFKIYEVEKVDKEYSGDFGEVVDIVKNTGPVVKAKNGGLLIKSAKPENKKKISGSDLINGNLVKIGDSFKEN